jgi:hypothetical protein
VTPVLDRQYFRSTYFYEPGARAYLREVPNTGHFALEENLPEIAPLIATFLDRIW